MHRKVSKGLSRMDNSERLYKLIRPYVPEEAIGIIIEWITRYGVSLTVTRSRQSVFGDYRWPQNGKGHRISINGDLNQYAFFITFVHEMAHLTTWEKHHNKVSSHGKEWKHEFRVLMNEFSGKKLFPREIHHLFRNHLLNPSYSHCEDPGLMKALRKFDSVRQVFIEEIPENGLFKFKNVIYRRGEKLRKRYKCFDVASNRAYLFNPVAPVEKI